MVSKVGIVFLFVSLFVFPLTSTAPTFVQTDITAFLEHAVASFLSAFFMVSKISSSHSINLLKTLT